MKKTKVRIALAVDSQGVWNACGWSRDGKPASDDDMMTAAVETVSDGENQYWVEVEVEIPEAKTVKGEATKVE
jgi:hypothetical protein